MPKIHYDTFTLGNGLKVIVHPDRSTPRTAVNILYRVGSKDEDEQRTGFAHLFEHLMFEGSKHIPHYDTPLQEAGGQNNAFTNSDITNYYLVLPSHQLETAFWLESDRMLELAFSEEKLSIQKSVVIEEYKERYLNQPYGDAYLQLRALHFQVHPYRWSTIGKEISHIEGATLQDVRDFFFGYYAPNNATLVVAGDVETEEVRRLAEKWFGPIPARPLRKHPIPQEPQQQAPRHATVYGNVPYPAVYKMYHMPAHTERPYYVGDLITDLLSSGRNARLYRGLVKGKAVAVSANSFSWGMQDPGALSIEGQVAEGSSIEAYEAALQAELEALQDLQPEDLSRIQNKVESSFVFQQTSLLNKAMNLAICDSLGDPELVNTTPEIYRSITLDELKAEAARLFAPENSSTLYYLPSASRA